MINAWWLILVIPTMLLVFFLGIGIASGSKDDLMSENYRLKQELNNKDIIL